MMQVACAAYLSHRENDKELKKLFMSSSLLISKTPDKGRCIMVGTIILFLLILGC